MVSDHGTALSSMKYFSGMETGGRYVAIFENAAAFIFYAKCMGRIIDHFQIVFPGYLFYFLHIAWIAIYMGGQYACSLIRDSFFYFLGVYVQGIRVNIYKYRPAVFPYNAAGGSYVTERGGYYLISQPQHFYGYLYGYGA